MQNLLGSYNIYIYLIFYKHSIIQLFNYCYPLKEETWLISPEETWLLCSARHVSYSRIDIKVRDSACYVINNVAQLSRHVCSRIFILIPAILSMLYLASLYTLCIRILKLYNWLTKTICVLQSWKVWLFLNVHSYVISLSH